MCANDRDDHDDDAGMCVSENDHRKSYEKERTKERKTFLRSNTSFNHKVSFWLHKNKQIKHHDEALLYPSSSFLFSLYLTVCKSIDFASTVVAVVVVVGVGGFVVILSFLKWQITRAC